MFKITLIPPSCLSSSLTCVNLDLINVIHTVILTPPHPKRLLKGKCNTLLMTLMKLQYTSIILMGLFQ